MLREEEKEVLKSHLIAGKKVVISTHKGPDGDAIGSSTALAGYLEKRGCLCTIIVPDNFPDFLKWVPGNDKVMVFDTNQEDAEKAIGEAEVIFSLDYNSLSRVGDVGPQIEASDAFKVMIDHHEEPTDFTDIAYHDATCCSTAQLIFDFIEELGDLSLIDTGIGTGIYVGILTDTGSFRFPSVNARTHEIAAHLIKGGLQHHKIHEAIYDDNSINRLQLNGFAVSERMELLHNGSVAVIWLDEPDLKRFKARKGDTEGLVNQALSVKGVKLAGFFRVQDGIVKISFRSKGDVYVNAMARDHFGGGGHKYAAGGMSEDSIEDTLSRFKTVVEEYV